MDDQPEEQGEPEEQEDELEDDDRFKVKKQTLDDIIEEKLKLFMEDKSLYSEAIEELDKEFPIKHKMHRIHRIMDDNKKTTYSDLLSLDEECNNFGRQVSNDGVFKKNPKTMELINNCPDKLLESVIRNNVNKYSFF